MFKYFSPDPEKNNAIYQYKCHYNSVYIGRTSQRLNLRRDQHVSKSLRNWMANRGNKPTKSPSAIRNHLLNYQECSKHYYDNKFTILTKGRNIYHLSVLEFFFYKNL